LKPNLERVLQTLANYIEKREATSLASMTELPRAHLIMPSKDLKHADFLDLSYDPLTPAAFLKSDLARD
jgi:hypothetical protein